MFVMKTSWVVIFHVQTVFKVPWHITRSSPRVTPAVGPLIAWFYLTFCIFFFYFLEVLTHCQEFLCVGWSRIFSISKDYSGWVSMSCSISGPYSWFGLALLCLWFRLFLGGASIWNLLCMWVPLTFLNEFLALLCSVCVCALCSLWT